jgi:hypothetical protein
MHSLTELKNLFLEKGHKIKEFLGWYLIVGKNRYTMLDDQYYVNGSFIKKKELISSIKQASKEKPEPKVEKKKPAKVVKKKKPKKKTTKKKKDK